MQNDGENLMKSANVYVYIVEDHKVHDGTDENNLSWKICLSMLENAN